MHSFIKHFLILTLILGAFSCKKEDDDDDVSSSTESCSMQVNAVVDLSSDVTGDFSENNVPYQETVVSSDCDDVFAGDVYDETLDSVSRQGNVITVSADGQNTDLTVSGTSFTMDSVNESASGNGVTVKISATYSNGTVDAGQNDLTFTYDATITKTTLYSALRKDRGDLKFKKLLFRKSIRALY